MANVRLQAVGPHESAAARWRGDGLNPRLLDAFLSAIGQVADAEECLAQEVEHIGGTPTAASALMSALLEPAFLERLEQVEERWLGALAPDVLDLSRPTESSEEGFEQELEHTAYASIARAERRAARIGVVRISGAAMSIYASRVGDSSALRGGGGWLLLPVGCLVQRAAGGAVLTTIGEAQIQADPDNVATPSPAASEVEADPAAVVA